MVKKKTPVILLFSFLLVAGLVFYFYSPLNSSFYPSCIFKSFTGLSCPGCGSQRAFHELLHFNFSAAFAYNPLFIVSIPYGLALLFLTQTSAGQKLPAIYRLLTGKITLLIIGLIVLAFFIFRNL